MGDGVALLGCKHFLWVSIKAYLPFTLVGELIKTLLTFSIS